MPREVPAWLAAARADVGLREIPGAETAPRIRQWLEQLRAWWRDDETPWCGVALAAWMRKSGRPIPREFYRARAWLGWGVPIPRPVVGAVVVFVRPGGAHVGIVEGRDAFGRLVVIGGNQGDAVSVRPFAIDRRVLGYRWPATDLAQLPVGELPLVASAGNPSTGEA